MYKNKLALLLIAACLLTACANAKPEKADGDLVELSGPTKEYKEHTKERQKSILEEGEEDVEITEEFLQIHSADYRNTKHQVYGTTSGNATDADAVVLPSGFYKVTIYPDRDISYVYFYNTGDDTFNTGRVLEADGEQYPNYNYVYADKEVYMTIIGDPIMYQRVREEDLPSY